MVMGILGGKERYDIGLTLFLASDFILVWLSEFCFFLVFCLAAL